MWGRENRANKDASPDNLTEELDTDQDIMSPNDASVEQNAPEDATPQERKPTFACTICEGRLRSGDLLVPTKVSGILPGIRWRDKGKSTLQTLMTTAWRCEKCGHVELYVTNRRPGDGIINQI